jgi:hypothetical protein
MKMVSKILLVGLLLGLLLLAGYAVYHYLLPRWVPILFYAYTALGLTIWFVGLVRVISESSKSGDVRQDFLKLVEALTQKSGLLARLARFRDWVAAFARTIANAILWPVGALSGWNLMKKNPRMGLQEFGIRQDLRLSEHYYSLFSLAVALAVFGLEFRSVDLGKYGAIVLAMMLVGTTLRHVCYSIQTTPLPAVLRRVSASPYLAFLVVILADFSTLILALTALSASGSASRVTWVDFRNTASQLLQAQEPLKLLLQGTRLTEHQVIVGVVGILFYLALLKTLLAVKEFKRKNEDHIWLASRASALGNFAAAVRHLRRVEGWSVDARSAEIVALIGVNEVDKAEENVRQLLEYNNKDTSPERIFGEMWGASMLAPVSEDALVTL